jgi:hypothetical protein
VRALLEPGTPVEENGVVALGGSWQGDVLRGNEIRERAV